MLQLPIEVRHSSYQSLFGRCCTIRKYDGKYVGLNANDSVMIQHKDLKGEAIIATELVKVYALAISSLDDIVREHADCHHLYYELGDEAFESETAILRSYITAFYDGDDTGLFVAIYF